MRKILSSLTELFKYFLLVVLKNFHTNSLSVNRLENYLKTGNIQIIWSRYLSILFVFVSIFNIFAKVSLKNKVLKTEKTKLYRFLILILILIFIGDSATSCLNAQESIPINLEKVLDLAGANNLTIKAYQEHQNLAKAHLAKAKEWWLPEIYAGANYHRLNGAAMNGNGNFFIDVERQNFGFGLGLNAQWDFAKGIYGKKAAQLKSDAVAFQTQAEKNKALLKSVEAYYDLMIAQLKMVAYQDLVQQSETITDQIAIQVDAGIRYQSELLLAKSNKNHLRIKMLTAQTNYNNVSFHLLDLLNLDQQVKLVSVDSILAPFAEYTGLRQSDISYKNRPELQANRLELEYLMAKKKNYTSGLLFPHLRLGYDNSMFGILSGSVPAADPVANPDPKQFYPTSNLNVSLLWKIPLGALTKKGDIKKYDSLIRLKEIETQQLRSTFNAEFSQASYRLAVGMKQIAIAKETLELTKEALSQSIQRQNLGTAKPFEVFQAQEFYLQSQLDYLEVVGEYNKAWFGLRVALGEALVN